MYSNLLHLNIDKTKSCCMYFPPNKKYTKFSTANPEKDIIKYSTNDLVIEKMGIKIFLDNVALKEVTETRF